VTGSNVKPFGAGARSAHRPEHQGRVADRAEAEACARQA
jgi:hypothetical protein